MPDTATVTKTYVSGEWEWQDTLDCYETAYAVVSVGKSINGFATPVVTADVLDKIIHRQAFLFGPADGAQMQWDGNGVRVVDTDNEDGYWLMPDTDGNFDLTPLGWTWEAVNEDDNVLRRIG